MSLVGRSGASAVSATFRLWAAAADQIAGRVEHCSECRMGKRVGKKGYLLGLAWVMGYCFG